MFLASLTSKQPASVSQDRSGETTVCATTLRQKLQIQHAISPSQYTPIGPNTPRTDLQRKMSGKVATRVLTNLQGAGMTQPGKAGIDPRTSRPRGGPLLLGHRGGDWSRRTEMDGWWRLEGGSVGRGGGGGQHSDGVCVSVSAPHHRRTVASHKHHVNRS